jgi:hypothetical protein
MRRIDLRRWLPFFVESSTPADRAFLIGQLQGILDALEHPPRSILVERDLLHLSEQIAVLSNTLELLRFQPPLPSATAASSVLSFAEPSPSLQTPLPAEASELPQTPSSQLVMSASLDASLYPARARLQLHSALRWLKITLPISLPLAFLLALVIAQTIASKEKSIPAGSQPKRSEKTDLRGSPPYRSLTK